MYVCDKYLTRLGIEKAYSLANYIWLIIDPFVHNVIKNQIQNVCLVRMKTND